MAKLILVRHGQSLWNKLNIFTGWVDIPLSEKGIEEALAAGEQLKNEKIDQIFVSTLCRAMMTGMLIMSKNRASHPPRIVHTGENLHNAQIDEVTTPVTEAEEINERMYGALQGCNKDEVKQKHGEEQFKLWRRSFDVPPPEGESLKMTAERAVPYYQEHIEPLVKKGKTILVSAHGNSLRALIMHLDGLSPEEVCKLEIPTGQPIIYELDGDSLKRA
jgi:2,3-bisphosphoglycerate-dependent phosphoglycerate mutase